MNWGTLSNISPMIIFALIISILRSNCLYFLSYKSNHSIDSQTIQIEQGQALGGVIFTICIAQLRYSCNPIKRTVFYTSSVQSTINLS